MARKERLPKKWPAWRYGPHGEAEIFQHSGEVPEGWVDSPDLVNPRLVEGPTEGRKLNRKELTEELAKLGVKVSAVWSVGKMQQELLERNKT